MKFKDWFKKNKLLLFGYFFIWIMPLILLVVCATTHSSGKSIKFTLWGSVVCFVIIVIYYFRLRKYLAKRAERELHEQNRIPVWIRFFQMIIIVIAFLAIIFALDSIKEDIDKMLIYFISSMSSVIIGYLFLMADSHYRKPEYLNRVSRKDSEK